MVSKWQWLRGLAGLEDAEHLREVREGRVAHEEVRVLVRDAHQRAAAARAALDLRPPGSTKSR